MTFQPFELFVLKTSGKKLSHLLSKHKSCVCDMFSRVFVGKIRSRPFLLRKHLLFFFSVPEAEKKLHTRSANKKCEILVGFLGKTQTFSNLLLAYFPLVLPRERKKTKKLSKQKMCKNSVGFLAKIPRFFCPLFVMFFPSQSRARKGKQKKSHVFEKREICVLLHTFSRLCSFGNEPSQFFFCIRIFDLVFSLDPKADKKNCHNETFMEKKKHEKRGKFVWVFS